MTRPRGGHHYNKTWKKCLQCDEEFLATVKKTICNKCLQNKAGWQDRQKHT